MWVLVLLLAATASQGLPHNRRLLHTDDQDSQLTFFRDVSGLDQSALDDSGLDNPALDDLALNDPALASFFALLKEDRLKSHAPHDDDDGNSLTWVEKSADDVPSMEEEVIIPTTDDLTTTPAPVTEARVTGDPNHDAPHMPWPSSTHQAPDQTTVHAETTTQSARRQHIEEYTVVYEEERSEEDNEGEEEQEEDDLVELVKNQMASYFPSTAGAGVGRVEQSLRAALRQDADGIIHAGPRSTDLVDHDTHTAGDNAVESADSAVVETPPSEDLASFFARYDFEVDADMMQDKILLLLQQTLQSDSSDRPSPSPTSDGGEVSPPGNVPHPDTSPICHIKHTFMDIFQNLDFEVDAEQMEEKIHDFHESLVGTGEAGSVGGSVVEAQPAVLRVSSAYSVHGTPAQNNYTTLNTQSDESVEDFYARYLSMRGTVIHHVVLQ